MELFLKKNVKDLLKKYGVYPSKKLGQNFLVDKSVLRKILQAADVNSKDTVLEIGPGIGTLTRELAKKAKKVIAVEKDQKMCEILKETLKGLPNVKIVQEDILKIPRSQIESNHCCKIVANLPYYIVSPTIRKLLEVKKNRPEQMVLMVQKEVAQRICSKPRKMSLLAVSVQFYAKPEIISFVSKNCFWPRPKVDSAILKITLQKRKNTIDSNKFFQVAKAGFSQPRKQIINNLSKAMNLDKKDIKKILLKNNIDPKQRAETLSVENWIKLAKDFLL